MKTITISANTSWYLFNFRASTIRRFKQEGYRVVCLAPSDDYSQKLVDELGSEWLPLNMDNMGSNPLNDMRLFVRFWRIYRKLKPVAAFHFTIKNNVYGTWAARLSGVPAINNVSGLGTAFIRKGLVAIVVRLLYKTSQPFAFRVFCQNEEDYAQLVNSKLIAQKKLSLLPGSGVDLDRFNPTRLARHQGPFRFLYAGRMLRDKGLVELVHAISSINSQGIQCTLWLSGFTDVKNLSSISRNQLEQWGELPGIEWLGPCDSMEEVYSVVDCVVLPSYREGMPRSLLEAGAMGLPVIATDVPGCRNIVTDGLNGLLCEPANIQSLESALQKILSMSSEERQKLGENGRKIVSEKYSEQLVVEAAMQAVDSAMNDRQGSLPSGRD